MSLALIIFELVNNHLTIGMLQKMNLTKMNVVHDDIISAVHEDMVSNISTPILAS